jgi:hypothetical protein
MNFMQSYMVKKDAIALGLIVLLEMKYMTHAK